MLCLPSIVPPLSVFLHIEPVRDVLVDPNHDVGLVRPKAEDRERAREGTNRFLKRGGSWPLNVPSKPVHERLVNVTVVGRFG